MVDSFWLGSRQAWGIGAVIGLPAAGQAIAVRAEGHAVDLVGVRLEIEEFLAGLGIPHFQYPALPHTAAGDALAIRAEGHVVDPAVVPLERP